MSKQNTPKLQIRHAELSDIEGVMDLSRRVYPEEPPYTRGQVSGQINAFRDGIFVAVYGGEIVGYAASTIVRENRVMAPHTWTEITGGGYASQHNGSGDWLYGMEVMVHPERRRLRIGKRLYQARERLCVDLGLKGIAFGGRMPGFRRHRKDYPDPAGYLEDLPSGGHAALMVWRNPYYDPAAAEQPLTRANPDVVRVASVQLNARTLKDPEEFYETVDYFTNIASEYGSDFVVFPEHFTLQLLSCEDEELPPERAIERATEHTATFVDRLQAMALSRAINIVGGSHATRMEDGDIHNVAHVFLRDGTVHRQEKLHPTPDERESWNIKGGDGVAVIETDCGPIGVLICYDAEFPEAGRRLADEGARILFVPYNTDTRHGHLRVRYCCQARAIENQCYVVTSGMVGNLDNVSNLDIQYAHSAIMTPCDFPFARDGIAAEASENVEMIIVADLNLSTVQWARAKGSVRNLRDRRFDLYRTRWRDGG